jgi:hypothetical protein
MHLLQVNSFAQGRFVTAMDRGLVSATIVEEEDQDAYLVACARVKGQIFQLGEARGITVRVEVDSGSASSQGYQIQITCGRRTHTIAVDHETFVDEEFFGTLVLHQIAAVIDKLSDPTEG